MLFCSPADNGVVLMLIQQVSNMTSNQVSSMNQNFGTNYQQGKLTSQNVVSIEWMCRIGCVYAVLALDAEIPVS